MNNLLNKKHNYILILAVLISGCTTPISKNNNSITTISPTQNETVALFDSPLPLKIGNEWNYSIKMYNEGKEVETYNATYRHIITTSKMIENEEHFTLLVIKHDTHWRPILEVERTLYENNEGLFIIDEEITTRFSKIIGKNALFLKTHNAPGYTWEYEHVTDRNATLKVILENQGIEKIEVPAGEFNAYKIESTITIPTDPRIKVKETNWFVLGVGIVKTTLEDYDTQIEYELLKYTLA